MSEEEDGSAEEVGGSAKIRDVLRLKYGLGRSHREIGAILWIFHLEVIAGLVSD